MWFGPPSRADPPDQTGSRLAGARRRHTIDDMADRIDDQQHLSLDELVRLLSEELTVSDVTPDPVEQLPLWEVSWDKDPERCMSAVTSVTAQVRAVSAAAALEAALVVTRPWLDDSPELSCTVTSLSAGS